MKGVVAMRAVAHVREVEKRIGRLLIMAVLLTLLLSSVFQRNAAASSQPVRTFTAQQEPVVDSPGIARFIRDEKGVSIIEFSGDYGINLHAPPRTIGQEFFRSHADVYDFLVVFSSFEFPTTMGEGEKVQAFHRSVRNDVAGIGIEKFDSSRAFGSQGVLQSYIDMAAASRWSSATSSADHDAMLSVFAHELQHRWGAQVRFRDRDGQASTALLGKSGSHWSYLLDSQGSVLYGASWRDNGDGSFTATETRSTYSPLDLYLAGLIDKSKVPPFVLIDAPGVDASALPPPVGTTIRGTKRIVTIDDIIAAEGPRLPSADASQKSFRFGFIYLVRPGETIDPADLDVVVQARRQVGLRYNALTHGLGTANVFAEPALTTAPGLPGTTLPPDVPGTANPGSNAAGLAWLKAQQRADGSFMDAAGLAPRDTLLARAYLRAADPAYSGLGAAGAWVAARQLGNTDFLARRLIASTAGERRAEDVSALLAARNDDGGWGLGERLRSNPLDTALAVQALRLANADEVVLRSAAERLLAWQNADGGWGNAVASPSRVHVSVQALKALAGLAGAQASLAKVRAFVKGRQNTDGGFGDGASSIHDTAHASMGMGAAGFGAEIDQAAAQRFVAENQRMDGSWQGSVYSTVLALQMLRTAASANLAIGNLQASPLPAFDGQRATLSARVVNAGSLPSQASTVRFFDGDPTAGGVAIGSPIPIAALVGGDGITVQATWNTTSRAGSRTLFAVVDFEQVTADLSRQDNITSLSLVVESANPLADLLLGDGDVLATPSTVTTLPAAIQIDALVSNAGMAGVSQAKAVLWSGTGASRVRIAETTFDLAARATTALQFKPTLSEPGTTVYTVELNPEGLVKEATRANNSSSATVKTAGGVSVAVSKADISLDPAAPQPGADVMFTARLRNSGTLDSSSFNVRYSIKSTSGTTVLLTNVIQIAAGGTVEQQIPWRAGPGGGYTFLVEMDPEKSSGDSDVTDNAAALDFQVAAKAGLNLAISYRDLVFSPSPAREGSALVLSVLVRNAGDVDATGFDVEFYEGDPTAGGAPIGRTAMAPLAAGASATASVQWEVPTASERLIFAVLDPQRSQPAEITLEDNVAFAALKVLALPDFAVSQGALSLSPSVPKPGEATSLVVTVSNLGEQSASDVVVSAFYGTQAQGAKLAPDVVVPVLAAKANASVRFSFDAPAASGQTSITVVVNPQASIKERVRDNNVATIGLGTQNGNFALSEAFISPDGDGVKDSTVLTYRLPAVMPVTVRVSDEQGRVVRTGSTREPESTGSWSWDGLDDVGRLVQDGKYELTVRNADGVVLGGATVEVDTNRSPLLAAIGTPMGVHAGLSCSLPRVPRSVFSISGGEGFYVNMPQAVDLSTDLPAGIYRVDEWGRGLRLVMGGPPSIQSPEMIDEWKDFAASEKGTRIVTLGDSSKLMTAGGDGEGKKEISLPNGDVRRIVGLVKDDSEVIVSSDLHRGIVQVIDINSAQPVLSFPNARVVKISPDRQKFIIVGNDNEYSLVNRFNNTIKTLPPAITYYWVPSGQLLIGRRDKNLLVLDAVGNYYNEINISWIESSVVDGEYVGGEGWSEDSSYLYVSTPSICRDIGNNSDECTVKIQRIEVSSGRVMDIASLTQEIRRYQNGPGFLKLYFQTLVGRNELLIFAQKNWVGVSPGDGSYHLMDLRSPYKISRVYLENMVKPPAVPDERFGFGFSGKFIEHGRTALMQGADPLLCERSEYGQHYYVFRTLANLQTDLVLSRRADGTSVKVHGGVADKNFARYWLDYASDDAPDVWHPIISANARSIWDKELANWVAPGAGRYTVRLTAEDLAGNKKQKLRRVSIAQNGPPITNVLREPAYISPNGDGSQDDMKLSYRVLEPVNLEFNIFNRQGALVRTISRNHPVGNLDASIVWDGRDGNGQVVLDGEYRVNVVGFDFFVTVDNSFPVVHALNNGVPFSCGDTPCRTTELRWSVEDPNFDVVQLEVGDGSAPARWRPYLAQQNLANNLAGANAVYLPLSDYVGKRYRLAAIDLAGNRTVAQFPPAQAAVKLVLAGQILARDLLEGEVPPAPTIHGELTNRRQYQLRPSAGIAMVFSETLDDPLVAVSAQFNEDQLAQKGEWLEQPNLQVYPITDGTNIIYQRDNGLGGSRMALDSAPEQSVLEEGATMPQNYGLVGFFNGNIAADEGLRVRLKLTGRSGVQYFTNEIIVQDGSFLDIQGSVAGDANLAGNVLLKTSRVAQRLEVFVSSFEDPYFSIERRILIQDLNSIMPSGSSFRFAREGRYVSCASYRLRAVVSLDNGRKLEKTRLVRNCGGVNFKVRPDFAMCGESAPHQLRGIVRPIPGDNENLPLLALEIYAENANGGRELVFNVVNPAYQDYEFVWNHGAFPEGVVKFLGVTTDRDGVKRQSSFVVPVDHTPAVLRITYPLENQRVCGVPELHKGGKGVADAIVNALRPVVEIDDAAGFDYLQEFRFSDDASDAWQPVRGSLPSLHYPDPKAGSDLKSAQLPYAFNEFLTESAKRPYMSGRRIAGELGPIFNISGPVTTRITAFDWSGAQVCRQLSFYLDGTVQVNPAFVDRRLFSPGTGSSFDSVALSINPMEPVAVTVVVRRVQRGSLVAAELGGVVRKLSARLSVPAGQHDLVWDGKDDGGNYVPDGEYSFDISYEDGCGNLKTPSTGNELDGLRRSLLVEVDRTAPALLLDRPLAGKVTSSFLDIVGSIKDKNLLHWALEYSQSDAPDHWMMLASNTAGVDLRKLAVLDATLLQGVVTLRLRAVDRVELGAEIIRDLQLTPRIELIRKFAASPSPFSPNGDGRRDALHIVYDVLQPAAVDLTVKRGAVVVRRLLSQASAAPGERVVTWDGWEESSAARAPDGEYTVEIRATSGTDPSNVQAEESTVLLDGTPPLFSLDPTLRPFMPGNTALTGSLADRSLRGYQAYVEGPLPSNRRMLLAEGSEAFVRTSLGTFNQLGLDDASYRIRVLATDEADNATNFQSPEFELDSKAPAVSFSNPAPGTFASRVRPVEISGLLDDRNLLSAELKISGQSVFAPPVVSSLTTLSFSFDGAGMPDGNHPVQLAGMDKAGNVGLAKAGIHVDNTPPVALITAPAANTAIGTMVPVVGTADDANMESWTLEIGSGVGTSLDSLTVIGRGTGSIINAELTKLVGLPPDGPATLRLTVTDKGGNAAAFDVPLQIDAAPPKAPVLEGQLEQRSDVRLKWTLTNDAMRIAGYNVYRNGNRINTVPLPGLGYLDSGLPDGSYAYAVTALSHTGVESARSNVVTMAIKASGPLVQISRPTAGATVGGLVSIEGSAYSAMNFRSYQVLVGAGATPSRWTQLRASALPVRAGVLATWSTAGLPEDALYRIRLIAEDIEGGVSTAEVGVTIDNRPPAKPLGLKAQLSGLNDVSLNWTASSEPDLAGYLLYRDGQLVNQADPSDSAIRPYLLSGTTYLDKALPDGTFVYGVVAVDKADNLSGRSDPASVKVDNRAPQAVIVEPVNGANVDGVVYVRAQSPDTDIASVRFQFKAAADAAWTDIGSASTRLPYSVSWDTKGLLKGSYQLRAVATDMGARTDAAPAAVTVLRKSLRRPEAPSELTTLVDGGNVGLNWKASASSDVRGYHVERIDPKATQEQDRVTRLTTAPVAVTTFMDADRPDGSHQYQVLAVNQDDNASDPSAA
ncbi:MAG: CARDB domain-containing protein, partial [Pseudomonadales bacterium]